MSKEPEKVFLNWSSGKDASMTLHKLRQNDRLDVDRLMTTVNSSNDRINMHGIHISLLKAQASALDMILDIVELPENLDMEKYNEVISTKMKAYKLQGIKTSAYGDIFLEDLRTYREDKLKTIGMKAIFPLWKTPTLQLMNEFIANRFKAIVVSVDAQVLDESFCGREVNDQFLQDLPNDVDPCGENGEFHTFCYDGPIFNYPVEFEVGQKIYKTYPAPKGNDKGLEEYGFWYSELSLK